PAVSSSAPGASTSASPSTSGSTGSVSISVGDLNNSFSAMATLKPLAAQGKGSVAVILPDTVSSPRYVEFDKPYLTQALTDAGLTSSDFVVQNALGSDATQLSDAQAD